MPIAPPKYDSQVNELTVFPDLKTAQNWLINNQLDTSGTSILVPFKDGNDKVHFLKPSNPNIFSDPKKTSHDDANKDIRIMGAANNNHIHGFFRNIQAAFTAKRVPHLNELEGDIINLDDHGFIIIYEKGEKKAGHDFFNLFEEEKKDLIEEIRKAQTNEAPRINQAKFLEKLSILAIDLEIKGGMCYFFCTDKHGNQHVYRDCFKQDANSIKLENYLKEETKWHESRGVKVKEHKWQNHHIKRFFVDCFKSWDFALFSAFGAGIIFWIFLIPLLGLNIAAAIAGGVALVTFLTINTIGFFKADKNNAITIEWSDPEFEENTEATFFSRIKQKVNSLFNRKSNETEALSIENSESEGSMAPIGIFTTIVSSTSFIPARNSASMTSSISALVNSSLSLFTFRQENELIKDNCLESSSPSLIN